MEPTENFTAPEPLDNEYSDIAWGIGKPHGSFKPIKIARPKVAPHMVNFELLYCGVCHSDVHTGNQDWGPIQYPFVGGHELLGKCLEVGEGVTKFKPGDIVAVGCMVESCLKCHHCEEGDQQYCDNGMTGTYNGQKKHGLYLGNEKTKTFGGYTSTNTVHEKFVLKIPDGMDLVKTAPILCAGITMYDPLRHWGFTKTTGKTVGIVGVGGLGTMGIKIAKALGHKVVAISTSANKEQVAKEKGADSFCVTKDPESIKAHHCSCDIILNTVSVPHDINVYLPILHKNAGTIVQLGGVGKPHEINQFGLMLRRISIAGSLIGGIAATQECIDFCAKHQIYPDCEVITADKLDHAWKSLVDNSAGGIRYVLDVKASLASEFVPK